MKEFLRKCIKVMKKIMITLLIIIVTIVSVFKLYVSTQVRNVFDEMYYSWTNRLFTNTSFINVELFGRQPDYKQERFMRSEFDGSMYIGNSSESEILFNAYVSAFVSSSKEVVEYSFILTNTGIESEEVKIEIIYDKNKRTLTFKPIIAGLADRYFTISQEKEDVLSMIERSGLSKEDIELIKETLLEEYAIREWVEGNGSASKFTAENPGRFTIIDNSYINLGEEWQD